ncbi:PTS transporter subunit EIIC [Spiroplasma poulsonii]|uniref:PTS transporter subunit EIIC n=1 Tax=Spiroplasma poulsonii TaxID=2138 RepID=UPI002B2707B9|nr:PTS transporter subunit EIIC [Spiroplasma poulsonii]
MSLILVSETQSKVMVPNITLVWGVFGGILAGCLVALIYNKYSNVKLPAALGFFSGRRFVPMVTAAFFLVEAFALAAIWPWFQLGLQYLI